MTGKTLTDSQVVGGALMAEFRMRLAHLLNGWLAASASQPAPPYTKRPDGTVRLSGNMRSGQVGAAGFELAADCRPAEAMEFPIVTQQGQSGSVMITALGQVVLMNSFCLRLGPQAS